MKISLVTPSFYPATVYGGPIFSTLYASQNLARLNDAEVFVSTTNANMTTKLDVFTGRWEKFEERFFVKYYNETIVDAFSLSMLLNVWKDIRDADVVHIQYMFNSTTIIGLVYALLFAKPIFLSPRGSLCKWCLEQGNRSKKYWLHFLIRPFVNKIVFHSTAVQEKDDIMAQFPNAQVEIIPNGIEYEFYQVYNKLTPKEFAETFIKRKLDVDKIIISMGRLQKVKAFDILIDSFSNIIAEYPNAKLFIAGQDEKEGGNLNQQIGNLGLQDSVFLIGEVHGQKKIDFFANADLFVLMSHSENFGNVYIESLAAGTPIVASQGTPWSSIEIQKCGRWVENSVENTSEAILEILKCDRELMRVKSKQFAKKYDWKYIAIQFNNVFRKMIKVK